jgi:ABC-type uncharacterized transport system substrate-binding protein
MRRRACYGPLGACGSVTGLSTEQVDIAGKRLDRLAILANAGNPGNVREVREAEAAARTLGLEVAAIEIRWTNDIEPALGTLHREAQALFVASDALLNNNRVLINTLALRHRTPDDLRFSRTCRGGGLMSYGPHYVDLFRRAADYVDKILRGTKPADLPNEQPTKFELVINLKTAKALDLEILAAHPRRPGD